MAKDSPYHGLKFEPVVVSTAEGPHHYVIRTYLPKGTTREEAETVKASIDKMMQEHAQQVPEAAKSVCSVVYSKSQQCFTIQLNREVPLQEQADARLSALIFTVICEDRPMVEWGEIGHRLRGGKKQDWIERN